MNGRYCAHCDLLVPRAPYCTNCARELASPPARHTPPRRLVPLPVPGQRFHTFDLVVASVWVDDEADEPTALLLTIGLIPPYYRVSDVAHTGMGWVVTRSTDHHNIVPATAEYESRGGDH